MSRRSERVRLCLMAMTIVVVLGMTLLWAAEGAFADGQTSGKCGNSVNWSYANGTLSISGSGEMDSFYSEEKPWSSYQDEITAVTVGAGITSIGGYAFSHCGQLTSVTLPSTCKVIEQYAFLDCKSLTEVALPANLEELHGFAFAGTGLTKISIPQKVETMGDNPFRDCTALEQIWVDPDNEVYTSDVAPEGPCNAIMEKPTGGGLESAVTIISGCKNTTIPGDTNSIAPYAFAGCTGLQRRASGWSTPMTGYTLAFSRSGSTPSLDAPGSKSS